MSGQSKRFLGLVLVLFSVVYLASCAVPPPTQELADAETAVQEARDMGAAECAPEELAPFLIGSKRKEPNINNPPKRRMMSCRDAKGEDRGAG